MLYNAQVAAIGSHPDGRPAAGHRRFAASGRQRARSAGAQQLKEAMP
jgi:hypothetical protein